MKENIERKRYGCSEVREVKVELYVQEVVINFI